MKSLPQLGLVLIAAFLSLPAFSQIQITENDLFVRGKYQMALDTNGGYTIGTSGASKTWDFSNLKVHGSFEKQIKDYNGSVVGANKIEIDGLDTIGYYEKTSNALKIIIPITDFGTPMYKKLNAFNFPLNYNSSSKDSTTIINYVSGADFGFPQVDSIRISVKIKIASLSDAWGSIKIPMGNFNALRIKSTSVTQGKFAAKTGIFPYVDIPGSEIDETNVDYIWVTNGQGSFLASYSETDDNMEYMTASANIKNTTTINQDLIINNPIQNQFEINNPTAQKFLISVFDSQGKHMASNKVESFSNNSIDASSMQNGYYLIQIFNLETKTITFKKIIKH